MAWDWNDILSGYWQEVDADGSGEVDTAVFFGGVGRLPSSLDPCLLQFLANLLGFYCGDQIFSKSEREREFYRSLLEELYRNTRSISVCGSFAKICESWRILTVCLLGGRELEAHRDSTHSLVRISGLVDVFFSRYLYAICTVENHNNMIWYHSISFYCNSYIDDHWCIVLHCDMFKYLNLSTFKYLNLSTLYVYIYICMYVCVCVSL